MLLSITPQFGVCLSPHDTNTQFTGDVYHGQNSDKDSRKDKIPDYMDMWWNNEKVRTIIIKLPFMTTNPCLVLSHPVLLVLSHSVPTQVTTPDKYVYTEEGRYSRLLFSAKDPDNSASSWR